MADSLLHLWAGESGDISRPAGHSACSTPATYLSESCPHLSTHNFLCAGPPGGLSIPTACSSRFAFLQSVLPPLQGAVVHRGSPFVSFPFSLVHASVILESLLREEEDVRVQKSPRDTILADPSKESCAQLHGPDPLLTALEVRMGTVPSLSARAVLSPPIHVGHEKSPVSRPSSTRAREKPPAFGRWCEDIWGPRVARTHHQQAELCGEGARQEVACAVSSPRAESPDRLRCLPGDPLAHQEKHHLSLSRCACGGKSCPAQPCQQPQVPVSALNSGGGVIAGIPEPISGSNSKMCSCCYVPSPVGVQQMQHHVFPVISLQLSKDQHETF